MADRVMHAISARADLGITESFSREVSGGAYCAVSAACRRFQRKRNTRSDADDSGGGSGKQGNHILSVRTLASSVDRSDCRYSYLITELVTFRLRLLL